MKKATRQQTKDHNIRLILKTIFQNSTISRAEIARTTSLTPTTVSELMAELIDKGLVGEVGMGASLGGKPPIQVGLLEDSRSLIGLDLSYDHFFGAVLNLRGKIQTMVELPAKEFTNDGAEALNAVYEILDQLMQAASQKVIGIAVGTPGLINTQNGMVINAVNLDWKNLPLGELLNTRYHLPVYILNDSQAAALGEYSYGKDHESDQNLVVINVRHGIGSGLILNGQLFQGDNGGAGEIGHVVVAREGGLPCRCGNIGCLETVASAQALVSRARMLAHYSTPSFLAGVPAEQINLEFLAQAFENGDPAIRQLVLETGRYMGVAIANLVGALNVHKIIVTGVMTCFGQPWLNTILDTMVQSSLPGLARSTQIEIGTIDKHAVILGATALLLQDYSLLLQKNDSTST